MPVLTYLFRGESDIDRDIAVELQRTLEEQLGIRILLRGLEWTVYLSSLSNLDYDLCRSSWVADYNDPNTFLNMFVTGDGNNRTGWSRKDYDRLIELAASETDPQRRFSRFHEAETILVDTDPPICPLFYWVGIQFYDANRLAGITPNLLDEHPLRFIHWKKR
jgi:oligopeptide transport system substrate-binding protein